MVLLIVLACVVCSLAAFGVGYAVALARRPPPTVGSPASEAITQTMAVSPATKRTPAAPSSEPHLAAAASPALVARGDDFVRARDVASARLFYQRAAELGDGRGALRMGATFDPALLDHAGIRGTRSDQQEALSWYRLARDLGDADADRLLKTLEPHERSK